MSIFDSIVADIINHYVDNPKIESYLPGHLDCSENPQCQLIGPGTRFNGIGYYLTSITIKPIVESSTSGEQLELLPVLEDGGQLYWIRESEGYENAPIIAHVLAVDNDNSKLMAWVVR